MQKGITHLTLFTFTILILINACSSEKEEKINDINTIEIPASTLVDKIRGGLLGQIIGNLNGLPHEFKYFDEPGNVTDYTPALPEGAVTDDDTDFEWVYIYNMQQKNTLFLPPTDIADLWKSSINERIWCSNQFARYLMDIGFEPPLTGNVILNPWAEFNISGQFLCETFGLLGPGMPQTASKIGLHYTTVAIDGEPAQTTQLFCSMIATAFIEDDINKILDAGQASIDKESVINDVMNDIKVWYYENPYDWKKTRKLVKEKYIQDSGSMRDINGHELNTAAIIASLIYGQGDFVETAKMAFNFGWDADCNAASALTIIGTMKGYKWMLAQEWKIVDRYKNTTRDGMPMDETITSFADRLVELAEIAINDNKGEKTMIDGKPYYRIRKEEPNRVYPLTGIDEQIAKLKTTYAEKVRQDIINSNSNQAKAKAAYLAICLNMEEEMKSTDREKWEEAVKELSKYWKLMQRTFMSVKLDALQQLENEFIDAGITHPKHWVSDPVLWTTKEICFEPNLFLQDSLPIQFKKNKP